MTDVFSTPDATPELRSSDLEGSLGSELMARAADALDPSDWLSGMGIFRAFRQGMAGGQFDTGGLDVNTGFNTPEQLDQADQVRQADLAAIPDVSIDDAKTQVKQQGLAGQVQLPDQPSIKQPVLDLMLQEGHERADRAAAIAQGPQGFLPDALGAITSIGAGMIDPVNAAAFSIPVLGEARWGKLLASAGDSIFARAGVRALQGAAQGAVGTAALQPLTWWLQTRDGQDYTMADALQSVVMGAGMGGAFHAGFGAGADIFARARGRALPGSPEDLLNRGLLAGRHIPGEALSEEGVSGDELAAIAPSIAPAGTPAAPGAAPAEALADLPPAAREDAFHVTAADLIAGQPANGAEMLDIAADHDPRIAESFDVWHGSPHDFDRFDLSRIGTGQGAQTFGRGFYFGENEKVGRRYQATTSNKAFVDRVAELYDEGFSPGDAWGEIKDHWSDFTAPEQRLMTALEKDDWLGFDYPHQAVDAALRSPKSYDLSPETADAAATMGNLYKVRIHANPDHFLDWDKSIDEQPPAVRAAIEKLFPDGKTSWGYQLKTGQDVVRALGSEMAAGRPITSDPAAASNALRDAGVPGIKYLDQGSRAAGNGSRNYVVFDDKDIEITHKNGEPVRLPERAAPVAESAPRIPDLVQSKKSGGRAAANPETLSLNEFLASKGGLRPDPELDAIYGSKRGPFVPGFGPLIRKSGMALDEALSRAKQHGYFFDPHDIENGTAGTGGRTSHGLTPNDLLDALDRENRGQKHYKPGHVEATRYDPEQEKHAIMGALEHQLAGAGEDVSAIDPKLLNRTVEIVHREGVSDVLDAYERAIMEDEERYNAVADTQQAHPVARDIPGFDDARAARGDDRGDQGGSGQAGGPEPQRGGPNGPQPPSHGARAAEAAADPRWRRLADVSPAENSPEALAESRQAEQLPEPASVSPERSLSALEKAAADAEEIWRQIAPTLSDEERTAFEGALDQLRADKDARDNLIRDGAACLMAAVM